MHDSLARAPVLVMGATGRIGAVLRRSWPAGRARWQGRRAPDGPDGAGRDWVLCDPLADPGALAAAARGCGAVLCLAGSVPGRIGPGDSLDDTADLALAAVTAAAAAGQGARVLLASSAAVYGAAAGPLAEDRAPDPVGDYGRAKAEMEDRAAALGARLGVPVTALRIGNIAGLDAILGGWRPGFRLDRFADGRTPRRSYAGPGLLARVLERLAAEPDLPAVLNLAQPGPVETGALLDAAGLGWTPRPAGAGAIPEVHLSTAALEAIMPLPAATPAALVADWRAVAARP